MSITTSPEERHAAAAKLAERTDEQLREDLAYWSVAAKDHTDAWNELNEKRAAAAELYQETQAWIGLITDVMQQRRAKAPTGRLS